VIIYPSGLTVFLRIYKSSLNTGSSSRGVSLKKRTRRRRGRRKRNNLERRRKGGI
jgi:hypothetical protein